MSQKVLLWGMLALVLCLLAVTSGSSDDEKVDPKAVKAAQEAILKLLDSKEIKADAETVARKHGVEAVMTGVFKPRSKGGLGLGCKPGAIAPDHIDLKINTMSKIALAREVLAQEAPDLLKMLEVVKATAEVTAFQCPVKVKMGDRDPKKWQDTCNDMGRFSAELIAAIKESDSQAVKAGAQKLYGTCIACHYPGGVDR